ncbi:MAG: hypothetical protein CM15mP22_3700 [Gammaproteobacteria bacterium]|nr:MAG: hypothetical protein CM15mP22_3700 [Gammaproteobacteria bacterium]
MPVFFEKKAQNSFITAPQTLLINNLEFDHADIFENLEEIKKQFHHLKKSFSQKEKVLSYK